MSKRLNSETIKMEITLFNRGFVSAETTGN